LIAILLSIFGIIAIGALPVAQHLRIAFLVVSFCFAAVVGLSVKRWLDDRNDKSRDHTRLTLTRRRRNLPETAHQARWELGSYDRSNRLGRAKRCRVKPIRVVQIAPVLASVFGSVPWGLQ
jgi:hypothetical protein